MPSRIFSRFAGNQEIYAKADRYFLGFESHFLRKGLTPEKSVLQ